MTFATKITVTRICMVPVFCGLAVAYGLSVRAGDANEALRWWALVVFVTAAVSDGIDGWVARRFNQRSDLGAYLDPIADKSLLLTAVLTLALVDWGADGWGLPLWFAVIVFLRDTVILVGVRYLMAVKKRKFEIKPHWSGKFCTVTQMFALGWVMLKVVPFSPVWPCVVSGAFTLWSGVMYVRQGWGILKQPASA
ncbi:MAG: CDP-alcohol phosphatidyltransferase family protein [Verrucomicrobiales bacterium]|nr:CDP-alcohol phosphatidyltransferase family protein [Verrucomicrobiota bacterium JB025]